MFRRLALGVVLALAALPAQADPLTDVIDGQLDAFIARDPARAFTFASPMIQGMFQTPENFGAMVAQAYPMIWTPIDPQFGDRRSEGARTYQRVILRTQEGAVTVMEYEMIETESGWRINGVREVPANELAV